MDWTKIKGLQNQQAIEQYLRQLISHETYGRGDDNWNLTELYNERSCYAQSAIRILAGKGENGVDTGRGTVHGPDGQPMRFKLRVLSRQACKETADGDGINWYDPQVSGTNDNEEVCPAHDEPPQPGDKVWIKGNAILYTDAGERVTKRHRMAMKARLESQLGREVKPELATYTWFKIPVDEDGCITVTFDQACQLLSTRGKRVASPRFASGKKSKDDERRITNWLFEEVIPGDEEKRPRRKPGPKPKGGDGARPAAN